MIARWSLLLTRLSLVLGSPAALAQIVTDGTVGPATRLSGPEMTIGAELGSTRGGNLFHSFQRFDIPTGQRATFTGPDQIQNVIGRVTGGQTSHIDGTLRSTVGQADVYLINPSGVVMGPNATVDVPAAVHVSTADEVRFSDGSRYSATDPAASRLTLAAPESFGFLSPQPASLSIEGSQLELKPGKTATLTAGDITMAGTNDEVRASLKASGGTLRLEAVGLGPATVLVDMPSAIPGSGSLTLAQTDLVTNGNGGGLIALRAGQGDLRKTNLISENRGDTDALLGIDVRIQGSLALNDGSEFSASTYASAQAGPLNITVGGLLEVRNGAAILGSTFAAGDARTVTIQAGDLRLDRAGSSVFTGIASLAEQGSTGAAGTLDLSVDGLLEVLNGAAIATNTFAAGDAGTVSIRAGEIRLDRGDSDKFSGIGSNASAGSAGKAGRLDLSVGGLLQVLNGAVITSSTEAVGDAGTVSIQAGELRLDGVDSEGFTGIKSNANVDSMGEAGVIDLTVGGLLEVRNGAAILGSTFAAGDARTVTIQAGDLRLDRAGSSVFTGIASLAEQGSTGAAGTLDLSVDGLLEVLNGAAIATNTFAAGDAGTVSIRAGEIRLDRRDSDKFSGIGSNASAGSAGKAGRLDLSVGGLLQVLNGAVITSSTEAVGDAGTVSIQAGELRLDGAGSEGFTGIKSNADVDSMGKAGVIDLTVGGLLEVRNGAAILGSTFAAGDARTVTIQAGDLRLDRAGSSVFTGIASLAEQGSTGAAGTLDLSVDGLLEVLNGAAIATNTFAAGDAGTVSIRAGEIRLDRGDSDKFSGIGSSASADSTGKAGTLDLSVDGLLEVLNGAVIATNTSAAGNAGKVNIKAYDLLLIGTNSRIESAADNIATGAVGSLAINAHTLNLQDGAELSIAARQASTNATPERASISIQAQEAYLIHGSRITTESQAADAGLIAIGGGYLWLSDSLITTSAEGARGNGGNITLTPEYLILDGGFIQANTAAIGASGGNIQIDSRALIASKGVVEIGGATRQTFSTNSGRNIIQAAAPDGEQGTISVTSPDLDITAALTPLASPFSDPDELFTNLCRTLNETGTSSLVERGHGGLPPAPAAPTAISFTPERLDRLQTASPGALE
jgi:filamentous hemagglutinin family protein